MKRHQPLTLRGGAGLVLLNHALSGGVIGWAVRIALVPVLLLALHAFAWWVSLDPAVQWLLGIGALALALALLWWQRARLRPQHRAPALWLPRRNLRDLFWVYDLGEWRDRDGRVLSVDQAAGRRDVLLHRVYIGKANDLEQRLLQHRADKPWAHDNLVVTAYPHHSEAAAFEDEARRIAHAAASPFVHERPRENRALNPSHDPNRCADMLQRAGL